MGTLPVEQIPLERFEAEAAVVLERADEAGDELVAFTVGELLRHSRSRGFAVDSELDYLRAAATRLDQHR